MWNVEVTFDAAHRAVLSAGKPLVYVCPPAGWALRPLVEQFDAGDGLDTLLIVPNPGDVLDAASALSPVIAGYVHAATGLLRTERLVRSGAVSFLIATPAVVQALVAKSALAVGAVPRIVWTWPERMPETGSVVDDILAEAPGAQRIIVTTDETAAAEPIQRHARRAPVAVHSRPPEHPTTSIRYATLGSTTRDAAVREVVETIDPERAVVWTPFDRAAPAQPGIAGPDGADAAPAALHVFADLPTAPLLAQIPPGASAVVLIRPSQLAYLRRLTRVEGPVRISREPDRIRERAAAVRRQLRQVIEEHDLAAELEAIEPLLDDFDPAIIAAAALREGLARQDAPEAAASTWTKVHLSAGRKDRIGPRDVVGALVNAVGLSPDDIGRIDVQDRFTLVDIRPDDASRVVRSLTGQGLRGVRITARLDRR